MIYLDNNATTLIDQNVVNFINNINNFPANPSSVHWFGRKAKSLLEDARRKIANSVNIIHDYNDYNIIFTSTGTEANNYVINSFKDYTILVSAIEHASILLPVTECNSYKIIPVDNNGKIKEKELIALLKNIQGPKIVSIMHANNETGVIQDTKKLVEIAHNYGAIYHSDAVQALGKVMFDIKDMNCDIITLSSHKCYGPIGAACLISKKEVKLTGFIKGGPQEKGLRAGTENVAAICGFGEAAALSSSELHYNKIKKLRDYMEMKIQQNCVNIKIYGNGVNRLPNTSLIMMPGVSNETQVINFDIAGIAVSAGSACSSGKISSSHVLKAMGVKNEESSSTIRISLSKYTTESDIEKFTDTWIDIFKRLN